MSAARAWAVHRRRLLVSLAAASPLLLVLAASVDRERRSGLDPGGAEAFVRGRPERCLACHAKEAAALESAHQSAALGCSSCHLGNPLSFDATRAHAGMERFPGDLSTARSACGERDCHARAVERVESSIMATARGIVSVNRFVFGEIDRPDGDRGVSELMSEPHPASHAESHLRKLCLSCHLSTRHRSAAERTRGGGCAACHLVSDPAGAHPQLRVGVSQRVCTGCHSRSGRVSLSYYGWHEGEAIFAAAPGETSPPAETRALADGRQVSRTVADVHSDAGLSCLDCHTSVGLMGDGRSYGHKEEQVDIECTDCHGEGGPARVSQLREDEVVFTRIRRLLGLTSASAGAAVARTRRGTPLSGVEVGPAGGWSLRRRVDGRALVISPLPHDAAHRMPGHERLSCQACHTRWTHQCNSCHTSFKAGETQWDHLAGRVTPGRWIEKGGRMLADEPTLGIDGRGRIAPVVPGMPICLELDPGRTRCRRLFAPADPHTTRRQARSCKSCHQSALALGLGRGQARWEDGAWRFAANAARADSSSSPAAPWPDGVPWDAWTNLDGTAHGESTRVGARPFSAEELRRILGVGRCVACHESYADPIYVDFAASAARRAKGDAPRCALRGP